jgi:hypothetical protein
MKLQSFSGAAFYARVCFVSLGIVGARRLRFHRSGIGPANAARQSPGDRCVGNALSFTATTLTVSKKGVVSLPADPRVSEGASPHIGIAVVGHPDVTADLSIAVRYDVAFVASFAGKPGFKGLDGLDGLPGSDGSAGSDDLSNPSAGGEGGDGTNGEDGRNGDPGQPGEAVHVWMALKGGDRPSGGTGFPPGFSGQNGWDGLDGHAGADGAAGSIVVSVDSQAQAYLNKLQLINNSGAGRLGPAPEIRIEAVAPIW